MELYKQISTVWGAYFVNLNLSGLCMLLQGGANENLNSDLTHDTSGFNSRGIIWDYISNRVSTR